MSQMSGEKVLVAVDESNCGRKAFEYAVRKSKEDGYGKLTALTVVEQPYGELSKEAEKDKLNWVESLQDDLREYAAEKNVELETAIEKGSHVADVIVGFAESNGYDLVIIGSHGRTERGIAKLGSVSQSVARDADMPVLVIT